MSREGSPFVKKFLRSTTAKTVTFRDPQAESAKDVEELINICADLLPRVQWSWALKSKQVRNTASHGQLENSGEGDYDLVAKSDFPLDKKLCLRRRGARRVKMALSSYVFQVKDLRNGHLDNIHATRLKLFRDGEIYEVAIMSHIP